MLALHMFFLALDIKHLEFQKIFKDAKYIPLCFKDCHYDVYGNNSEFNWDELDWSCNIKITKFLERVF
jgi:hypothetical protein